MKLLLSSEAVEIIPLVDSVQMVVLLRADHGTFSDLINRQMRMIIKQPSPPLQGKKMTPAVRHQFS